MFENNRKKRNKKIRNILLLVMLVALCAFGYSLNNDDIEFIKNIYFQNNENSADINNPKDIANNLKNKNNEIDEVIVNNIINNDTKFICKTYIKNTDEVKTKQLKIPDELLDKSYSYANNFIKNKYKDWNIKQINSEMIEIYKVLENDLINKYIIKENNERINIYKYDNEGKEKFIKLTDINFNLLNEIDQQYFKKGIIKNNLEEINQVLEDFIS